MTRRDLALYGAVLMLFVLTGALQSWNLALAILNMALVSALMALGLNMQWGFAGLFSTGVMGFVALGGLAVVLVSAAPVPQAQAAGGPGILAALATAAAVIAVAVAAWRRMPPGRLRGVAMAALLLGGWLLYRAVLDPAAEAVETFNPAAHGNLGGLGWPVLLAWPVGGALAAAAAWAIGKTSLGLRSDYLAIATLGIAEIVLAVIKNEDWLARGVKNVIELPRPTPYEVELQRDPGFLDFAMRWGADPVTLSSIVVKLLYAALFLSVLLAVIWLSETALRAPWGRMMRAIRDNEVSAAAMGKDVTRRHLEVFVIGSAVIGVAGAMMTTLDGQFTPGAYTPLRFTFLIWVMVIVGGSGSNAGSVLGAFLIWWLWIQAEPIGLALLEVATAGLPADSWLRSHLQDGAAQMRLMTMGAIMLIVLRFSPRGLIPER